jgi:hypothetical protein
MFVLGSTNDLSWMKHVVSMLGSGCNLYEFGNEPDNAGSIAGNIKGATSEWIADVPALRAINPHALFGGPALTWSSSADGSQGSYPSDMAYFLAKTAAANERADFISYHDYPCTKATSMAQCISMTPGDFQWNWDQVIGWENEYYGRAITTGISEYNFDPGTANLDAWGHNGPFMYEWTRTAVNAVAGLHMAFANQYDSLNYGGYGYLDMFSDSAPYGPKPQFNAMASEVRDYDPLSTKVLVPSNGATLSGSAVLDASVTAPGSVTAVTFDLSGGSLPTQVVVATAVDTMFGWIAKWNTASVANGTYRLQSVVTETGGSTASSPKVSITVSNKG